MIMPALVFIVHEGRMPNNKNWLVNKTLKIIRLKATILFSYISTLVLQCEDGMGKTEPRKNRNTKALCDGE